jgi:type IV secretory pathway TraG/TraD family ATPase VirD4
MAFPFFGGRKVLGPSDPRAMYAGCYRYPNGSHGAEIRIGDTRPKIIVGGNSAGKGAGIIIPNALKRTGISQVFVDTRCQAAAVAAPWRSTVDRKTAVSNAYGCLDHLPEYADLQGGAGINLLEAPELDPGHKLCTDHLTVMASTILPADNDHQPYFPTASQSLFIAFCYGELVEARREGRKPLLANVRGKVLERSRFDAKNGEPVAGMAWHARQILALGNPFVNSCIDRFADKNTDEMKSVIGSFESKTRFMMSPMLAADEQRGGLDFGEAGRQVSSYFLAVPAEHVDACSGWFRLAITGAMRPLFAPHPVPVTFWLDEFYALKRIPLVDQIGVVAGSKIEIIIVVQSLSMLKHLYGEAWEAFLGNAGAIILVGSPGDATTCDYLVKRSGETTIIKPQPSSSVSVGAVTVSTADVYHQKPTVTANELYDLKPGTGFIWLAGHADPVPAAFPGYWTREHPEYRILSRRARRDPYVRW